jgi:hypothetical protein
MIILEVFSCYSLNLWDHTGMKTTTTPITATPNISRTAKDALARLMATENIRVQHSSSASTAMFDVVNRVLILPVWEDMTHDLYDMLVTHEVGHALFTPADVQVTEAACDYIAGASKQGQMVAKQFLNIIEDARIERLMKDKFPGSKRSFFRAYSELWDKDFFQIESSDVNKANLADRINLYFKGDIMGLASVGFNADEQVFIDRASTSETFDEVIEICADLYEYMKMSDPQDDQQDDSAMQDADDAGDADNSIEFGEGAECAEGSGTQVGSSASDDDADDAGETGNGKSPSDTEGQDGEGEAGTSGNGSDKSEDCGQSMTDDTNDGSGADSNETDGNTPQAGQGEGAGSGEGSIPQGSTTERSFSDAVNNLASKGNEEYSYYDVPTVIHDEVIVDFSKINEVFSEARVSTEFNGEELLAKFSRDNKSIVNNMAKQFEMKKSADADRRTMVGKSGKIDMGRVHSYRYNEDIFLRSEVTSDGKNHGMVMFVDWSGSMCDCISDTIEQVMCLALFCKKVQIPFEVYAFSSSWYDHREGGSRYDRHDGSRQICKEYTPILATEDDRYHTEIKKGDVTAYDKGDFLDCRGFHLMNLLSSRAKKSAWKESAENLLVISEQFGRYKNRGRNAPRIPSINVPNGFGLGGTPLNEAILAACTIVPAFRDANNLQVVNTVFLTDGEASSMNGGWGHNVVRNPRTGMEAEAKAGRRRGMTETLLNYFRKQTGAKAIGMFLSSAKSKQQFARTANGFFENQYLYENLDTLYADWKKEHFFAGQQDGYDAYFVINAQTATINVDLDDLGDDASYAKIKNTFSKGMAGQQMSRVLLNRFVDLVATELS